MIGPGNPGPGGPFSPWNVSGATVSYSLGGIVLGAATGGSQGIGTINATAFYKNGDATFAFTDQNQTFSKSQRAAPGLVSGSLTITLDMDAHQNFDITLTHGASTLANPSTTPVAGQSGLLTIHQSATGGDTIGTFGSDWIAAGGTSTITLSSGANAIDVFSYYVIDATHIVLSAGALNCSH